MPAPHGPKIEWRSLAIGIAALGLGMAVLAYKVLAEGANACDRPTPFGTLVCYSMSFARHVFGAHAAVYAAVTAYGSAALLCFYVAARAWGRRET
jgi:hypothetical protein